MDGNFSYNNSMNSSRWTVSSHETNQEEETDKVILEGLLTLLALVVDDETSSRSTTANISDNELNCERQ